MNNRQKAEALEARDKVLRDRLTKAFFKTSQQPLNHSSQIPLIQTAAYLATALSMRIVTLGLHAITNPDDSMLAASLDQADVELTNLESWLGPLLDQLEA